MIKIFTNIGLIATPMGEFPYKWMEWKGGEIIVKDGKFYSLPWEKREIFLPQEDVIVHDCNGALAIPGFVDSHTHLIYAGNRANEFIRRCYGETYQEIAQKGGGIKYTVQQTRAASAELLLDLLISRLQRALKSGTTTIEIKASYGLEKNADLKQLKVIHDAKPYFPGIIVPTCLSAHEIPVEWKNQKSKYIEIITNEILPAVKEQGIAQRVDVYCEKNVFDLNETKTILLKAKELGFLLTIHCDQWTNLGGAYLAAEIGVQSADHLEQTDRKGFIALKEANVVATILPGSIWFTHSPHYPNAKEMIELGVNVAVASDHNPGSSMFLEFPLVLTVAALGCKLVGKEAITAATLAPAKALGLQNQVGSIEIGKDANFTLWNINHYDEISYHCGGIIPTDIIVQGNVVTNN
ncbi:MAG: imidazolonepropionase [bacterium]|nr:imidazolonepropionase [bacterium]